MPPETFTRTGVTTPRTVTTEAIRKGFARRLRAARVAAGYDSARAFAKALGVHEMTYGRWERGEVDPPLVTLVHICQLAQTTPDFLLLNRKD